MDTFLFVGAFTRAVKNFTAGRSKGVNVYKFNTTNGTLNHFTLIPESQTGPNPSSLYVNNGENHLYVVNELSDSGAVKTLSFDFEHNNENLSINQIATQNAFGTTACNITCDLGDNFAYVANYGAVCDPSLAVYKVDKENKDLLPIAYELIPGKGSKVIPDRQLLPHIHCLLPCKDPLQFYCADLGRDLLLHYKLNMSKENDPTKRLEVVSQLECRPGDGPRHLCYHPFFNNVMYVALELGSAIGVIQIDEQSHKLVKSVQTVTTLPSNVKNDFGSVYSTSQIACDLSGKYVYCANRGHDSIVKYNVNQSNGLLEDAEWFECGGKVPRHFAIDPTNNFLCVANQEGHPMDNVTVFRINHSDNGRLEFVQSVSCKNPSWIHFIQKPKRNQSKL